MMIGGISLVLAAATRINTNLQLGAKRQLTNNLAIQSSAKSLYNVFLALLCFGSRVLRCFAFCFDLIAFVLEPIEKVLGFDINLF